MAVAVRGVVNGPGWCGPHRLPPRLRPSAEVVGVQQRLSPDCGQRLAEKIKILAGQINDEAG